MIDRLLPRYFDLSGYNKIVKLCYALTSNENRLLPLNFDLSAKWRHSTRGEGQKASRRGDVTDSSAVSRDSRHTSGHSTE